MMRAHRLRPRPKPHSAAAEVAPKPAKGIDLEDGVVSGAIAKWLIPSVTALFATVGYLVQFAHEQLLGVAGDHAAGSYVAAAADFFRALPTILYESLSAKSAQSWHSSHPQLVALATVAAVAGVALQRLPKARPKGLATPLWLRTAGGLAPLLALILIMSLKFLVLDVPLGAIKGVLISESVTGVAARQVDDTPTTASTGEEPRTFTERTEDIQDSFASRTGLLGGAESGPMPSRVRALWLSIVCSRVNVSLIASTQNPLVKSSCPGTRAEYLAQLNGEFITHLWLYAMIVVSALGVLSSPKGAVSAGLAILALAYGLTLANAYGKLMKSTEYDYGVVRLSEALQKAAPKPTNERLRSTDPGRLEALILSRGSSGLELLVVESGQCADNPDNRFALIKQTWLANSQVLSVREIYRQDAITWVALNEVDCPPPPPPMP